MANVTQQRGANCSSGSGSPVKPLVLVAAPAASPRVLLMIWLGVRPAQGPGTPSSSRHSATAPATCGAAWLVPSYVLVPPPSLSADTQVPGAATVCARSVLVTA